MRALALRGNDLAPNSVCLRVKLTVFSLGWVPVVLLLASTTADYQSVQRKFNLIEAGHLKPGARVELTPSELNAYVEHEVPMATGGVRQPRLSLLRPEVAEGECVD